MEAVLSSSAVRGSTSLRLRRQQRLSSVGVRVRDSDGKSGPLISPGAHFSRERQGFDRTPSLQPAARRYVPVHNLGCGRLGSRRGGVGRRHERNGKRHGTANPSNFPKICVNLSSLH